MAMVTDSAWAVVMLDFAGVTVTVGVIFVPALMLKSTKLEVPPPGCGVGDGDRGRARAGDVGGGGSPR